MHRITRRLEICAGHRLLKHRGKCQNYHGHQYVIEVSIASGTLADGMVVDFAEVKDVFGHWLDDKLDHGMILQEGDPFIPMLKADKLKHFVMDDAPTAENLAKLLYEKATELLDMAVTRVRIYETPNCWADFPYDPEEE